MQMSAGLVMPSETLFYLAAQVFASAASSDANHYLKSYQLSRSSLLNSFNMGFITKQLFIHQPACSFSDWLSAHWFYFLGSDTGLLNYILCFTKHNKSFLFCYALPLLWTQQNHRCYAAASTANTFSQQLRSPLPYWNEGHNCSRESLGQLGEWQLLK